MGLERHSLHEKRIDDRVAVLHRTKAIGPEGRLLALTIVDLSVSGNRYGYYRADAVVVATSTGSTAYSYAAGGPVVSPSAPVVVMTPVAPMAGISRPLVLGDTEPIGLAVTDTATVEIDGISVPGGCCDTELHVELQRDAGQVVRLDAARYGARSRVALSLLDLPLRPDQLLELVPPQMRALRDAGRLEAG